jgi:hypothetical protein
MKDTLAAIGMSLLMHYAGTAFVLWEPNPGNWSEISRFVALFLWVASSCMVIGYMKETKT